MIKPDFNYINQLTGGNEHLCARIMGILQLEYQFSHPDEQSFYFKSGLKSQKNRLDILTKEYESFRNKVNDISSEELASSLKVETKKLAETETLSCSRWSQVMARSISRSRIDTIQLYQTIKHDVGDIPDLDYYRQ